MIERDTMRTHRRSPLFWVLALATGSVALVGALGHMAQADDLPPAVKEAEAKRIAAVNKARPSVVAVFAAGGQGGGSGVLIDEDGYALTNFHVVEGSGPVMQCGLPDGEMYDGVLVGLDKVGDVALIKLLPRKPGQKFPFAKLGDSDKTKAGDWSLAMGNPFLLATDFSPTVTFGLISGVNRYQYPAGTLLEYTDCIQMDTSINPGNSGGPLFNIDGELIGINGRGSFEKRGRVNSGVGYAISINQIKNFMGQMRAGLDTDHATLGAAVKSDEEEGSVTRISVVSIIEDCDAYRRGLRLDDEVLRFGGRDIATVNHYKNILGLYPKGWRVPVTFRHSDAKDPKKVDDKEVLVRLMGVQRQELKDPNKPDTPRPNQPQQPKTPPIPPNSPAAKLYIAKPGFANYYFNKQALDKLLADFEKNGDFKKKRGQWVLEGEIDFGTRKPSSVKIVLNDAKEDGKPTVALTEGSDLTFEIDVLKQLDVTKLMEPPGSGGFLVALYHWRQLLTLPNAEKTFEAEFRHGGTEPFYAPGLPGTKPDYAKARVDADVIRTQLASVPAKWFFSQQDHSLLGFEVSILDREDDPCEVYLSDYKKVGDLSLPHTLVVQFKDQRYATLTIKKFTIQ